MDQALFQSATDAARALRRKQLSARELTGMLLERIDANGYRSAGYSRELYIECGEDRDTWVTELQEPIATS